MHAKAVEKLITPKTKLVVINSPHNPTGAVVPPGEMEKSWHWRSGTICF